MTDQPRRMDIREFRRLGYLQEANRQFFHPLGLALEVIVDNEDGSERLGGVSDYRDDPEGIYYGPGEIDDLHSKELADQIAAARLSKAPRRLGLFGSVVQQVGPREEDQP